MTSPALVSLRSISLLAILAAGCAVEDVPESDSDTAVNGKADGTSSSVVARHCELFGDRAGVATASQSFDASAMVFVKTLNTRLDGAISKVGFEGVAFVCKSCNVSESGGPTLRVPLAIVATPFFGAADYFQLALPLRSTFDRDVTFQIEGHLYVETVHGTRYTARAEPGDRLALDENDRFVLGLEAYRNDVQGLTSTGLLPAAHPVRQRFNPDGCF